MKFSPALVFAVFVPPPASAEWKLSDSLDLGISKKDLIANSCTDDVNTNRIWCWLPKRTDGSICAPSGLPKTMFDSSDVLADAHKKTGDSPEAKFCCSSDQSTDAIGPLRVGTLKRDVATGGKGGGKGGTKKETVTLPGFALGIGAIDEFDWNIEYNHKPGEDKMKESWMLCDCIHKDQPAGGSDGLSCCSGYAKNGVCGGIPPLSINQPHLISVYNNIETQNKAMWYWLPLVHADCMFPTAPAQQETSWRKKAYEAHVAKSWGPYTSTRFEICGPRPCGSAGETLSKDETVCCSLGSEESWDTVHSLAEGETCGCTLPGVAHNKYIASTQADCCSKRYSTDRVCSCLAPHEPVPEGVDKIACCTQDTKVTKHGTFCSPSECVEPGDPVEGEGSKCCASKPMGRQQKTGETCGCVSHEVDPENKHIERCCAKRGLNVGEKKPADNQCGFVHKGEVIETWFHKQEEECFSGKKRGDTNVCMCMAPHSKKRSKELVKHHVAECCSGRLVNDKDSEHDGYCACISSGDSLPVGLTADSCCSGKEKDGVCSCSDPSEPFRRSLGMEAADCCSGAAGAHVCQCVSQNDTASDGRLCCGEYDPTSHECLCIPDGHRLPDSESENPERVCCNAPSKKCSKTCGA